MSEAQQEDGASRTRQAAAVAAENGSDSERKAARHEHREANLDEPLFPVPIAWTDGVGREWRFERAGDSWKVFRLDGERFELVAIVKSDAVDVWLPAPLIAELRRLDELSGKIAG